jgi:hypothetical protein
MSNIPKEAITAQRKVVDKFNKSNVPFFQILTQMPHGFSMDCTWHLNGSVVRKEFLGKVPKQYDFDVIMFLDIDAVPLNDRAIDSYIEQAYNGSLVGNIQRTNHIQNGQHVFVAPSAMAISDSTFLTIGRPSALETSRSDVAEEYTWLCEKHGIPVKFYMPAEFEAAPLEAPQGWALADGMPRYGLGTTFADPLTGEESFWHNFQIRLAGQHERFLRKCDELLKEEIDNGKPIDVQPSSSTGTKATG